MEQHAPYRETMSRFISRVGGVVLHGILSFRIRCRDTSVTSGMMGDGGGLLDYRERSEPAGGSGA